MNRRNSTVFALTTVLIIGLGLLAQPAVADNTSAGKATFDKMCAKCHGDDGAGQTTIGKKMALRDLGSAEVQKMTDADWTKITADGSGKMPGFSKKLSKEEIQAVVQHMRTFKN